MAETPGAEPVGAAYFGWYLWAMGPGRPRTPARLGALLEQAGFTAIRPRRTRNPLQVGLLVATAGDA
jgi:demethylspheroidene O-methyltransferase